jgi:hypothetical protein
MIGIYKITSPSNKVYNWIKNNILKETKMIRIDSILEKDLEVGRGYFK